MRKNTAGPALRKKAELATRRSTPNGSRQNSSSVKSREARSRARPHARELDHITQRYADLYDFAPTGYVSFDRSGRVAEINLTAAQLFGLPRQHLIGMPFSVFVFRDDVTLFLHHLLRCRASDAHVETELRLKNSKREIIHAQLCSTPITASPYNGVVLFQTSIVDLTERKRSEQALRQKEAELELIVTQTPFMFTRCTRDLRYRYVSRAYAEMLGREPEEIAGKSIVEIMGTEGFETIRPYVDRVLSGETVVYEGVVLFKDIGPRVLSLVYVPDKEGDAVIGWIASILDITERRRGEQQVRVRDAVSHALAESGSLKKAAPRIIEAVCDVGDWEAGVLWDMNHATGKLYCVDFWHRSWVNVPEFEAASRQWTFPQGIGLPGRVWLSGKPAWVPDVTRDDNFPRAPMAVKEGLHAGLCFPIKLGKQMLGAVECFSRQIREPDNQLLEMFASVGSQIGQFIERKRAEDRFRLAVESAPNAMVMVNQKGEIVLANSQTEKVFGYKREELLGKSVEMLVPQRVRRQHAGDRTHFSAAPQARAMGEGRDLYGLRKDGSEVPIEIGLNPIQIGGQTFILSSIVDITERKKAEAVLRKSKELLEERVRERTHELHSANKELKNEIERRKGLEGEILSVSDREQQRLGQELHDGLCQHLTAVAFMARSIALRLRNHRVIDAADIEKIAQLVNDAATDTRNLSRALHRVDIDAAGLVTALQDLVDREIWRTACRLEVKPSFRIDDNVAAAHLYRIAREAVINANKHAQARKVVIKLERARREMVLRVIDDGVGLSSESKLKQGLGFPIMNYRAHLMGARLEIESPKRGGTCVSCYLPDGAVQTSKSQEREDSAANALHSKIAKSLGMVI